MCTLRQHLGIHKIFIADRILRYIFWHNNRKFSIKSYVVAIYLHAFIFCAMPGLDLHLPCPGCRTIYLRTLFGIPGDYGLALYTSIVSRISCTSATDWEIIRKSSPKPLHRNCMNMSSYCGRADMISACKLQYLRIPNLHNLLFSWLR